MKTKINREGFTLVEMLVASTIMVITFVGLLLTFVRCLELNEMSRNSSLAVKILKSQLEKIKNTTYSQIFSTYNNVSFTNSALTGRGVNYIDNSNPDLLKVTVIYCWREKSGRIIGEDTNLNGVLNSGEDKNANGEIDSPVELVTYISRS